MPTARAQRQRWQQMAAERLPDMRRRDRRRAWSHGEVIPIRLDEGGADVLPKRRRLAGASSPW